MHGALFPRFRGGRKSRVARCRPFSLCGATRSRSGAKRISIDRSRSAVRSSGCGPWPTIRPAIRHVLLDNAANYRKDDLQLRVLSPGLGNGLLTAQGDTWRLQRRSLAPLFSPREVAGFAPAMQRVAEATVERLGRRRDGAVTDVAELMSRMALEVLEQTLFSQGLGREPSEFQRAVTSYFDSFGRLDPLDLIGAPAFLPRLGRIRGRGALRFFNDAVEAIVASRKTLARARRRSAARSAHSFAFGEGSRNRPGHARGRHPRQHHHLHRRRP